jgi:hypothetical protein
MITHLGVEVVVLNKPVNSAECHTLPGWIAQQVHSYDVTVKMQA